MTTVALIGIGSNSVRLLVAEREGVNIRVLERSERVTRLGGYRITANGRAFLTEGAMRDTLEAAQDFAERVSVVDATLVAVVATEAMRAASNSDSLKDALESALSVPVTVLSGEDEASLGWCAASTLANIDRETPIAIIDIGGASTDLSVGYAGRPAPEAVASVATGGRTAMRRFSLDLPIERSKLMGVVSALAIELSRDVSALRPKPQAAVVIGGTASVLKALQHATSGGLVAEDAPLDVVWLDRRLKEMSVVGSEARAAMGVPADRADIIVAGAAILLVMLQLFGPTHFHVSERNILDGYLQKNL